MPFDNASSLGVILIPYSESLLLPIEPCTLDRVSLGSLLAMHRCSYIKNLSSNPRGRK
jgi:hypothetical protein